MADSSTTVRAITIPFPGACWARRQLHAGMKNVPVQPVFMKSRSCLEGVLGSKLAILYSMADYSTTSQAIPILFTGGCWARRQLHAGIRYVPVASKLMKSLSCVEGVLGSSHGRILLDGRLLHYHWTDLSSVCWTLLGATPATRRYNVRLCGIKARDIGVPYGDTILAELYSMADYSTTV